MRCADRTRDISRVIIIVGVCGLFTACSREARLYPSNDSAASLGFIKAQYVDYGLGHGPITAELPNGEKLSGEYSTEDNAVYGFGSVISKLGNTTMSGATLGGSQRGVASLIGERGTRMRCEYFVNVMTASGAGACQTGKGEIYQLHF
jgi:hypothetical protein